MANNRYTIYEKSRLIAEAAFLFSTVNLDQNEPASTLLLSRTAKPSSAQP